jgi:RNA 3'-terminal phosphate cyclase (ATP)
LHEPGPAATGGAEPLRVDGSMGEGGGQVFRSAIALSALLERPLEIHGIRSRRKKPGLRPQHLTGLRALAEMTGARVEGDALHSTEVRFSPGPVRSGRYRFATGTAGSTTLLLQTVLLPAAFSPHGAELTLEGGTDVPLAPPFEFLRHVVAPAMGSMGLRATIRLTRRGYYPEGGGAIEAKVPAVKDLDPFAAEDRGSLRVLAGVAHASRLPNHIPRRMAHAARSRLETWGEATLEIQLRDVPATGTGITLWASFERAWLGAGQLGRPGRRAEVVGERAGSEMVGLLESGATVDTRLADQLVLPAALASGSSVFLVPSVSTHLETNLALAEQILGATWTLERPGRLVRVTIDGIGFSRKRADRGRRARASGGPPP